MNAKKRQAIFARLKAANPHPKTELKYGNPFQLLIAVLLSAQATDISVNKATATLFAEAGTASKMLALGEKAIKKHIQHIGLFNTKAKHIVQSCQQLIEQHASQVPNTREALICLPGVGRKTANVILNTAFNQPTMAVDTHIFRLSNRIPLAKGKTVLEVERGLLRLVPKRFLNDAHHWIILHGRYVCTARKPKCPDCLLKDLCEYKNKTEL